MIIATDFNDVNFDSSNGRPYILDVFWISSVILSMFDVVPILYLVSIFFETQPLKNISPFIIVCNFGKYEDDQNKNNCDYLFSLQIQYRVK